MVKLTMIARVTDGLPLAEGLDDGRDVPDADFYKQQVKSLFKNLSRGQNEASRMSVETGPYLFHYIIEGRTRNVQEVLGVGEKLDQVSQMSSRLTSESRIYAEKAKDLNRQALIRKCVPVAAVLVFVFLLFWAKNKLS
ncbi:SNAP receptor [Salvia divinorum]|uniref:SNAP receptor n=1 Tax=Salvia divinorum TaxID=28513 RepID=A0ABD1H5U8_SALDI